MTGQDPAAPAETAIAALRDLTDAVRAVAERMFDLPAIPGTAGDATTGRK